ncbi:hypothetical protein SAMN06265222_101761 [Neorhodopirellula lusitana]|uniref:Uncharacterized protein n=1 Tax=Neorhodopirellula lusitana TaxID=445327 RepID=A0ABY1PQA6_9BACT|nr:hypothetical protein SAMN06265222_101761 [Neorhodopirellula lusitana]
MANENAEMPPFERTTGIDERSPKSVRCEGWIANCGMNETALLVVNQNEFQLAVPSRPPMVCQPLFPLHRRGRDDTACRQLRRFPRCKVNAFLRRPSDSVQNSQSQPCGANWLNKYARRTRKKCPLPKRCLVRAAESSSRLLIFDCSRHRPCAVSL